MNTKHFLFSLMILIGLILILTSCTQSSSTQMSTTPTLGSPAPTKSIILQPTISATPTPLGGVSNKLGPVPKDCPQGPAPKAIGGNFGPVVGTDPVWGGNFVGPHAMLIWVSASEFHNQYGWSHKLLWVVANKVKGFVMIRGANLRDGVPLRPDADTYVATSTSTTLVLNPQDPNLPNRVDQWAEFPGSLTIPEAGCYVLEADWPGGHWRITFAAGVIPSSS